VVVVVPLVVRCRQAVNAPAAEADDPQQQRIHRQFLRMLGRQRAAIPPGQLRALMLMAEDRDFGSEDYETLLALDEDTPTKQLQRATPFEIRSLPAIEFVAPSAAAVADGDESRVKCLVCLEPFCAGEKLRLLPCLHRFHR
jgi:hypothetical protein